VVERAEDLPDFCPPLADPVVAVVLVRDGKLRRVSYLDVLSAEVEAKPAVQFVVVGRRPWLAGLTLEPRPERANNVRVLPRHRPPSIRRSRGGRQPKNRSARPTAGVARGARSLRVSDDHERN
jgi:hypothetical protein